MYQDNPFHDFHHASHVTDGAVFRNFGPVPIHRSRNGLAVSSSTIVNDDENLVHLVGHSYGIASDPLTQFAALFSAIVHTVTPAFRMHSPMKYRHTLVLNTKLAPNCSTRSNLMAGASWGGAMQQGINLQGGGSRCQSLSNIARGKCNDALFCRIIGIEIDQSIQGATKFETSRPGDSNNGVLTTGSDDQEATNSSYAAATPEEVGKSTDDDDDSNARDGENSSSGNE